MFSTSRSATTPWGATLSALMGLLWCGYVAFPNSSTICTTAGCALYENSAIFGISMWWIGGAAFFVLTVLCLRGYTHLAWQIARLGVALDCVLLLIMFFSAPCVNCLIVAGFFALTCFCLRPKLRGEPLPVILLPLWLGLFIGNIVLVTDEVAERWTVADPKNAVISIYFSPSCKYCHNALKETAGKARLFPVIKDDDDLGAILRLEAFLAQGIPMAEALERSVDKNQPTPKPSLGQQAYYAVQLLRNKAYVFKHGRGVLPLVLINGGPSGDSLNEPAPEKTSDQPDSRPTPSVEDTGRPAPQDSQATQPSRNSSTQNRTGQNKNNQNQSDQNQNTQNRNNQNANTPNGSSRPQESRERDGTMEYRPVPTSPSREGAARSGRESSPASSSENTGGVPAYTSTGPVSSDGPGPDGDEPLLPWDTEQTATCDENSDQPCD